MVDAWIWSIHRVKLAGPPTGRPNNTSAGVVVPVFNVELVIVSSGVVPNGLRKIRAAADPTEADAVRNAISTRNHAFVGQVVVDTEVVPDTELPPTTSLPLELTPTNA